MENLPFYVYIVFALAVLVAVFMFYKAAKSSSTVLIVLLGWLVLQSLLSISGFYKLANTVPPRFPLLVMPPFFMIAGLFITSRGKQFIDGLNIKTLALLHVARVLVELVLFWLFVARAVPVLMTFEGRNFDVVSGLSAPLVYYFGFVKKQLSKAFILVWNVICLALVVNVAFYAVLSSPTKFQQFAFDQPNIALGYFPFVLLPSLLVPLVVFAHLVSIRQLLSNKSK
jgi:hypothetical protein